MATNTKSYKGRKFYIFGEVGEPVSYTTKSGAEFTFRIGHEYCYRANGSTVGCMFLGYDTAKERPCFAEVAPDGDFWYSWPGDKRTLGYMEKHALGEPCYVIDVEEEAVKEGAIEVSLENMKEWCKERNLLATQKREGCCIWVEGDSKPYADELK